MGGTHGTMSCTQNRKGAGLCLQGGRIHRQAGCFNGAGLHQASAGQSRAGRCTQSRAAAGCACRKTNENGHVMSH